MQLLPNCSQANLRRIAHTGTICALLLLVLVSWLIFELVEGRIHNWLKEDSDRWHGFALPVLTNLVSTMVGILAACWYFFGISSAEESKNDTVDLQAELTAIKNDIRAIQTAVAQRPEPEYSFADILDALAEKDKQHNNTIKSLGKNFLPLQSAEATTIKKRSNSKNKIES